MMGEYLPTKTNDYCPVSVRKLKDDLIDAILYEVDVRGIAPREIHARLPSIRAAHLTDIRGGGGGKYGLNRLVHIAEAIGLRVEFKIKGASA